MYAIRSYYGIALVGQHQQYVPRLAQGADLFGIGFVKAAVSGDGAETERIGGQGQGRQSYNFV